MADPMFKVNGREYPIPTDLTLGEMCDAEQYFGVEFGENQSGSVRMAAALLWVAVKRAGEKVTVDDIRALDPSVFAAMAEADAGPPDEPAAPTATSEDSGLSSSNGGASPDVAPAPTGSGGSERSSTSPQATSQT